MKEELRLIEELEASKKFVEENFEKLQEKYPNEFVAVRGNRILGHSKNPKALIRELEKMGEDLAPVLIEFIPEKGLSVIY